MRVIVTGQVGVEKRPYLDAVSQLARSKGLDVAVCHIGDLMYAEAPDVPPGSILNLPISRLNTLRRAVFKEVLRTAERHEHLIVNTHATFRWRHGLFAAFDVDQVKALDADLYVTLLDNVESVHQRLLREHDLRHTLKDIMVWREEELLATEMLANFVRGYGHFFMISRGRQQPNPASLVRLMFEPWRKRVYPSFPMSHVMDLPAVQAEINDFRARLADHFITFDPGDVDEFILYTLAEAAADSGEPTFTAQAADGPISLATEQVRQIVPDIMGQIYARDFKMIDQSQIIVSLIPELPGGKPALSSGVERELQHAYEGGKEAYVVWKPRGMPSPFITETATRVFRSVDEAMAYFDQRGYLQPPGTP